MAPRLMKSGISYIKTEVDSFSERRVTDCYFVQKGRCAYQKLNYVLVSDVPDYENMDCVIGCNTFAKIGKRIESDLQTKLMDIYVEANYTKIPIALVVIDILLVTDVPSASCSGLVEVGNIMRTFTQDYSIVYKIHGQNKIVNCAGHLMIYNPNPKIFLVFNGISLFNTVISGNFAITDAVLNNATFLNIYEAFALINVNAKGILTLFLNDPAAIVTSAFFHETQVEVMEHLVFKNFRNLIISNSSLPIQKKDDFSSITSIWLYESVLRVGGYLLFEDLDEFAAYRSRIQVLETANENLPILRVTFCKIALIFTMTFDGFIGKSSLRIEQTAVAVINELTVTNGIAGIAGHNVQFRNIRSLTMQNSLFENNVADQSSLRLNQVSSVVMRNVSFINNTGSYGAISFTNEEYTYTSLAFFEYCSFIRNSANIAGGGAIYISYTPALFSMCTFKENYATVGGAIYSRYGLHLEDSLFINNKALHAGGAVLALDLLGIQGTNFLENSVISKDVVNCNKETCKGYGGAIYFDTKNADSSIELISNRFDRNSAVSGGAISVRMLVSDPSATVKNNTITNNNAIYSGGGVFYSLNGLEISTKTNIISGNSATSHGNDISTPIRLVEWGQLSRDFKQTEMTLYPGQAFSFSPTFTDFIGTQFYTCKESFTSVTTPEIFSLSTSADFKNMFVTASNSTFVSTKITTRFTFLRTSAELTINVIPCPNGFSVNQANYLSHSSSYICKANTPTDYIIIVAVCVTIVVFALSLLVLSLVICLCVKAGRKVLYWVQRDKAEKDIEKRLLENEYISINEPGHQPSNNDRKNSFVISIDQIFLEKKIGEGGSGVVYLGKWHHNAVAVKCLRIDTTSSGSMDSDEIEKEAALLCKLRHPNIVLFYGISISLHKQYLIVEYLEKGSLEKLINEMRRTENPTQISFVQKLNTLIDITCGMVYLHSLKIIHRDLKPANILIDSKGVCKVCDFGLSKIMSNTCHTTTTCVGTLFYIAPEVMKSDDGNDDNTITTAVDVFSFSIIMWEMFFEDNPYMNGKSYKLHKFHSNQKRNSINGDPKTPFTVLARVMQGERPLIPFSDEEEKMEWLEEFMAEFKAYPNQKDSIGLLVSEYLELMKSCWADDHRTRPTFETVLNCLLLIKRQMQDITEKKNIPIPHSSPKYLELIDMN